MFIQISKATDKLNDKINDSIIIWDPPVAFFLVHFLALEEH